MPSPLSFAENSPKNKKNPRVAVLLYGMVRDYDKCANSLKKALLKPNDADMFFFGPAVTDYPDKNFSLGLRDGEGFIVKNPKTDEPKFYDVDQKEFKSVFGDFIRGCNFHHTPSSFFSEEANRLVSRDKWLFGLPPARILSMFYNMAGVVDEFDKYRKENSINYDAIVITRPDLVFYNSITADIEENIVHIPLGEGFDDFGRKPLGNAPVFFYKNSETGEYVPGGRSIGFNDQILVIPGNLADIFSNIYETVKSFIAREVPLSPETMIYLLLKNHDVEIEAHGDWDYEIYRRGQRAITSILNSPELKLTDKYHPLGKAAVELPIRETGVTPSPEFAEHFRGTSVAENFHRTMHQAAEREISGPEYTEIGLAFNELPAYFRFVLGAYSIFLNERLTRKLKNNTRQFFEDAKNRISLFLGKYYLALSVRPGVRVYKLKFDR